MIISRKRMSLVQAGDALAQSAELSDAILPSAAPCEEPREQDVVAQSRSLIAKCKGMPPPQTCAQRLTLSFFFDGTGNNLEADFGTREHSNVARLFRSHPENDEATGSFKYYIPGIATYFKEVEDPGNTTAGQAFGAFGQARLDWAKAQLKARVATAVSRANNPTNPLIAIRIAVFGFSRGATLARAFCRELQKDCERDGMSHRLKEGKHPIDVYFLGLFDTVASVGLPKSFNNTPVTQALEWTTVESSMRGREHTAISAAQLAFGEPGADPAPGMADGHMDWANPLDVAPMVQRCLHIVAAHEIRNSFPLDSASRNHVYPDSVTEIVYPGAHSDVGGGYRPGEAGRSAEEGELLSMLSLRLMHQHASEAGVPLWPLEALRENNVDVDFAMDDASREPFARLSEHFTHYLDAVGKMSGNVGQQVLAHMRLYYAWRFQAIRARMAAHEAKTETAEEQAIRRPDAQFERERRALEKSVAEKKAANETAASEQLRAEWRLQQAEENHRRLGTPIDPALQARVDEAKEETAQTADALHKEEARQATLPGTADGLIGNLAVYDRQLLADARQIQARLRAGSFLRLRPHYKIVLDAYEAEFDRDQGLRDEKIIAFFERYVHDSLATFATDATLPSDPRVIYVGDDVISLHAKNKTRNIEENVPA